MSGTLTWFPLITAIKSILLVTVEYEEVRVFPVFRDAVDFDRPIRVTTPDTSVTSLPAVQVMK